MARYKHIDVSPRFLAVDLHRQLLPGSFEHALNHLIDFELDLSSFDTRLKKSNRSDNESAKMATSKGVIQGAQRDCLVHNIEKRAHTTFREPWLAESRRPLVGHHGVAQ